MPCKQILVPFTAWSLLFQILFSLALLPSGEAATRRDLIITQALARVGDHVLTLREVEINGLVEQALYPDQAVSEDLAIRVNAVLLEWVVYLEAKSFSMRGLEGEEMRAELSRVQSFWKGHSKWGKWEVSEGELSAILNRKAIAKNLIQFKSNSSLVPVSDQEAFDYFEKNRSRFGQLPFSNFKDNIKKFLAQQRLDQRLKDWFEVLQKKYKIQVYSDVDSTAAAD